MIFKRWNSIGLWWLGQNRSFVAHKQCSRQRSKSNRTNRNEDWLSLCSTCVGITPLSLACAILIPIHRWPHVVSRTSSSSGQYPQGFEQGRQKEGVPRVRYPGRQILGAPKGAHFRKRPFKGHRRTNSPMGAGQPCDGPGFEYYLMISLLFNK